MIGQGSNGGFARSQECRRSKRMTLETQRRNENLKCMMINIGKCIYFKS